VMLSVAASSSVEVSISMSMATSPSRGLAWCGAISQGPKGSVASRVSTSVAGKLKGNGKDLWQAALSSLGAGSLAASFSVNQVPASGRFWVGVILREPLEEGLEGICVGVVGGLSFARPKGIMVRWDFRKKMRGSGMELHGGGGCRAGTCARSPQYWIFGQQQQEEKANKYRRANDHGVRGEGKEKEKRKINSVSSNINIKGTTVVVVVRMLTSKIR
jgi:hypothetical protein